tara:strand:- start:3685 stop:4029 length:345 start_codon:yes stop_codon:yes gene_type:complete
MKRYTKVTVASILCISGACLAVSNADNAQMKQTMTKIVNQLEMIKPLIDQAQDEQDPHQRVMFHFDSWTDANGKRHNGLRQDINQIESGVVTGINRASVEPRRFRPINGDYIGR